MKKRKREEDKDRMTKEVKAEDKEKYKRVKRRK
jgi:hypothetical protein